VNAAFFALAFTAALNPKLLGLDLLLASTRPDHWREAKRL